jgi:crotonobetaine/carnitine-CoA ligase
MAIVQHHVLTGHDPSELTIDRVLYDRATRFGDRVFLRCSGQVFSYSDVDGLTNRYANGLAALGIRRGDHVAVMLPNCPEFLWLLWGLGKLGAVAVPLNTAARGDLLTYFLAQSEAVALCVSQEWAERAADALGSAPNVRNVLVAGDPAATAMPAGVTVGVLDGFGQQPTTAPSVDEPVRASDPHLLMYTSGTTGPSKGAVCPHSQGLAVGRQMSELSGYDGDDVFYTCLPLFHVNALWFTVYAALWSGASVAVYPRFSASSFWDQVRECRATVFNCLGAMANILWQQPPTPADRNNDVRICMMVPASRELTAGFAERFGITVTSVYAMTENCAVTVFRPDDPSDKVPSAGRVRDEVGVAILDEVGRQLPAGEVGEICVRPHVPGVVMHGYYRMGDATVASLRDFWFHTGDRGYLDGDNYLYFVDRTKEAIRRRGENISAYEVETAICTHPGVLEAAAVPVDSELGEDEVMVYLVVDPECPPSMPEVIDYCNRRLPYYMVPRFLDVIDALPKTPSQKVEKYRLKQTAARDRARLWDREAAGIELVR